MCVKNLGKQEILEVIFQYVVEKIYEKNCWLIDQKLMNKSDIPVLNCEAVVVVYFGNVKSYYKVCDKF